ncbi:glycosyltransferase family 4 protein (plasmid) [Deinococcus radiomollis]|uniref:glycosyltransferase family 4 protein n=1 Tax=Deinococcus radiomollis TaxID=468916 RepID=UPI00389260BB
MALTPYPLGGPSSRYRVYAFQEPLKVNGVQLDIQPFLTPQAFSLRMNGLPNHPLVLADIAAAALRRIRQAQTSRRRYDLLYIHRQTAPSQHAYFDKLFLQTGLPIVFDMDDAVFSQYSITSLLQGSVAATVGNRHLAEYVGLSAPSTTVTIIPTVVDTRYYTVRPALKPKARPVVGWIGTGSTFRRYLLPVLPGLVRVCREAGAEFRVIASTDVRQQTVMAGAAYVPWSLLTEVQELQSFDIGVMPLSDDEFVRGKCAFKLIQYGAVGIPSVGTDIGANGDVIRHGVTGYLAPDAQNFEQRLAALLSSDDLGRSMGLAARRLIEEQFSLHSQTGRMAQVLHEAAGR